MENYLKARSGGVRLEALERRVLALEKIVGRKRRLEVMKKQKSVTAAKAWITKHLGRCKARTLTSDLSVVPAKCEVPPVMIAEGKIAGFSAFVLHQARTQLSDEGVIEVTHVPGSKKWMWRLM